MYRKDTVTENFWTFCTSHFQLFSMEENGTEAAYQNGTVSQN